jgi:signal peptidase I
MDNAPAPVTDAVEATPPARNKPRRNALAEWVINILILVFGITLLVQSFIIPTVSMEDTLMQGDHIIADKLAYAPQGPISRYLLPYSPVKRGDIIVFRWPIDPKQFYVKRVIGVPGDRIKIVAKQVYLNGKPINEPYKFHKTPYFDSYRDNFPSEPNVKLADPALAMLERNVVNGELVVPPDNYFAMGDNRDNSLDSRYWGFVPRVNIIAKPVLIWWSYNAPTEQLADRNIINIPHLIDLAKNFFRKTRWKRTFRTIHGYPIN